MFFSHSDHAVGLLDEKGVQRLQKFSKTWFGNVSWVCQSLHEAFPSICELVEASLLKPMKSPSRYIPHPKSLSLLILGPVSRELITIYSPLAKVLTLCSLWTSLISLK